MDVMMAIKRRRIEALALPALQCLLGKAHSSDDATPHPSHADDRFESGSKAHAIASGLGTGAEPAAGMAPPVGLACLLDELERATQASC